MAKSKNVDFQFEKFYVYYHVDPRTNQIVYIGMGSGGRAWCCSPSDHSDENHSNWIKELLNIGYTPDEFVQVIRSGLERKDALIIESRMIKRWRPVYNRLGLVIYTLLTEDQQNNIIELREIDKLPYSKIAEKIGSSTMTVQRWYVQYQSGKGLKREVNILETA